MTVEAADREMADDSSSAWDPRQPRASRASWAPRWWLLSVLGLTAAQMLVRWWTVTGLDSYHDDIAVTYRALDAPFGTDFLLGTYAGHWGPVNRLLEWTTVHAAPFDTGVAFGVVLALLLVADAGMILLLRRLVGPGRLSLLGYAFWAVTPLVATTLGSWSLGLLLVPLMAGMAWTLWAYACAVASGRAAWQVSALLLLTLTLLVSPQALLLVPAIAALALAYPGLADSAVSRRALLRRLWLWWVGAVLVLVGYAAAYIAARPQRSSRPVTAATVGETLGGLGASTGVPSLVGGPWASDPGALPSVAELSPFVLSLTLQAAVVLVALSVGMRRWAWRGWLGLAALWLVQFGLVAGAVRPDLIGAQLLRQTRYLVPVLVPTVALLVCVFGLGPARSWLASARRRRRWPALASAVTVLLVVVLAESSWYTNYAQAAAMKAASTAPFWQNVRRDLAANPDGSIVDRPMPDSVLVAGFLPELGPASRSLSYFVTDQDWDGPAEKLLFLRDDGHLVAARVEPFARSYPGTQGCGYLVRGPEWVTIPLDQSLFNFGWGVRLNYLAADDTRLEARASGITTTLPVSKGLGSITWVNAGVIPSVEVRSAAGEDVAVCVDQIVVGGILPG